LHRLKTRGCDLGLVDQSGGNALAIIQISDQIVIAADGFMSCAGANLSLPARPAGINWMVLKPV